MGQVIRLLTSLWTPTSAQYAETEAINENMDTFQLLSLKRRDVLQLYRLFQKVDVDGSGEISMTEMLEELDITKTEFTERVFAIFDVCDFGPSIRVMVCRRTVLERLIFENLCCRSGITGELLQGTLLRIKCFIL